MPDGDAAAYVDRTLFALTRQVVVTLALHAPYATVAAWFQPTWGELEPLDDRRCVARLSNESYEPIVIGIALSGLDFDVIDPPELRGFLAELGARLGRAAVAGPD